MWRMNLLKCSAIEWIAQFRRDPCALLIVVLAGLGTAHILVRTATCAAVPTGSIVFLWGYLTGSPPVGWPPLFPLLLAAFGWVGVEPLAAGRWINATAFGLTILAAGGWLRSNLRSQWLVLAATAAIAASLPLSHWAAQFITEPLFFLFTLLALSQLAAFLHRKTTAPLWWAAVFTALAAITRYPGVALIGTGVLVLLPAARRKHTLIFGAVSSVPLLAVLARNWAATGNLRWATGYRTDPSGQSLFEGLSQAVKVLWGWVVPRHAPDGLAYLLGLAVAAVVLAGATVILRYRQSVPEAAPAYLRLGPIIPFGGFAVAYLIFMVLVVPFTVEQGIDSRYLMPIYVPLLLTAVFLLDRFLSIAAAGWMEAVRYGLVSLVVLTALAHVGFSAYRNLRLTAQAYVTGYENGTYNIARWQHSEILNYLSGHHFIEGMIYSNRRPLARFAAGATDPEKHRNIPRKMGWTEIEVGAHIVWFERFYNRSFLSYDDLDLRVLPGMETVAELADGVVFHRAAAEPFDAERHRARKQRYVNQLIQQASERVVRAGWSVYRTGHKLIYRKKPCAPADTQAKFVLHVTPADPADLPAHRERYGYDNLGFYFDRRGFWLGDECIAIVRLPNYAIGRIRAGQWVSQADRTLWEAAFPASQ